MPPSSRSPNPYSVHYNERTGRYYFFTDSGPAYVCGFQNLTPSLGHFIGIYDIEIGEFSFFKQPGEESQGHDARVSDTVVNLMRDYFDDDSRVLVYVCDASDGRPAARQALFTRWHRNMADMVDHEPVQIAMQDMVIYGGIFTRKDFPYRDVFPEQLRSRAAKLIAEKFGR